MRTFVFIFTGEFGYELLNWNGVVRKWVQENKQEDDTVVVCSRKGLELIYEMADYYIDISDIDSYKNSIADCYCSFVRDESNNIVRNGWHQQDIFNTIKQVVDNSDFKNVTYIYSPVKTSMNGCLFGTGGIYGPEREPAGRLNLFNNKYIKFEADLKVQSDIENHLNINLDEPYILCQTAARDIVKRDKTELHIDEFIISLSQHMPVICLGFDVSKKLNSKSAFDIESENVVLYNANTLNEQSCLIEKSKHCVFFSEGDFRSHMYVPPLFGKSVTAIATEAVFNSVSAFPGMTNAPINFWNEHVWNFGGKIEPLYYEEIASSDNYDDIIKKIIKD
jgi:hypothetical protein